MNRLPAYLMVIVIGCLCITFGVTHILPPKIQWTLLIIGILLNMIAIILLYFFLQKEDARAHKNGTKKKPLQ
ncbi:hypothetical protein [Kurthia senegalensis]|uniref:hypothetical protein n=1 Tax=Kurthia senegalensis TaxID=1033740 RepID=UPI000289ECA5|nr:hypothetical protein [Kurthia senegalensis]